MRIRKPLMAAGLILPLLLALALPAEEGEETPLTQERPVAETPPEAETELAQDDVVTEDPEDPEVLIVRPPPGPPEPVEEEEVDETALGAAERRITELETRVADLEEALEEMFERQTALEEALARLDDLEEAFVEREAQRAEAAAARTARVTSLDALAAELDAVFTRLSRGFDDVDRPMANAASRIESFAGEAARFGQALEAERLQAASAALGQARAALRRRDLYETRLYVGLALGHVQSARDMARAELSTP
jgi:hypothetical protein